jgi:hypothetical protein
MAIINCTECGGNVSTLAAGCPHCGAPVRPAGKPDLDDLQPSALVPVKSGEPAPVSEPAPRTTSPKPTTVGSAPASKMAGNLDLIIAQKAVGVVLFLAGISLLACFLFDLFDFGNAMSKAKEGSILHYLHRWFTYIVFFSIAGGSGLWGHANQAIHKIRWQLNHDADLRNAANESKE